MHTTNTLTSLFNMCAETGFSRILLNLYKKKDAPQYVNRDTMTHDKVRAYFIRNLDKEDFTVLTENTGPQVTVTCASVLDNTVAKLVTKFNCDASRRLQDYILVMTISCKPMRWV